MLLLFICWLCFTQDEVIVGLLGVGQAEYQLKMKRNPDSRDSSKAKTYTRREAKGQRRDNKVKQR